MYQPQNHKSKIEEKPNPEQGQTKSLKTHVKRRMSLQNAVKSFKSKIGGRSSSSHRTSDGYQHTYYPESEVVGYPVAVEKVALAFRGRKHNQHITEESVVMKPRLSSKSRSSADFSKSSLEPKKPSSVYDDDDEGDTFDPAEEEKMKERFKRKNDHRPSFAEMHGDDPARRPSINVYQSIDDDHPDLQSIQNLVANMTFGADLD